MATSKTLSPTNVTISIPAMGDQPDASVFSNCIDKEADAINTLNSQITNVVVDSFSSFSALGTVLDGMLTTMQNGGTKNFQISAQAGVSSPFVGDTTYFGTIYKSGSNTTFSHVVFRSASQSIEIIGRRNAYGWGSWDQIASASQTEIVVPTFTNESSVGTSNLAVRSVGHIVLLNGYYTFTNAPTSNVQIATLGNHLPILTVRTMCALASGAYLPPDKLAYFTVDANGAISVTPPSNNTNKVMYVSCSWVSNA